MKTFRITGFMLLLALSGTTTAATELVFSDDANPLNRQCDQYFERLERRGVAPAAVPDSLKDWWERYGYLDTRVTEEKGRLHVRAGSQARLRVVRVHTDSVDTLLRDEPFTEANVSVLVDSLLGTLDSGGHYYARVIIDSVAREETNVALDLTVIPGPEVRVGKREYSGLVRTRASVLSHYLNPETNLILSAELLRQDEQALSAVPFVRFLPPARVHPQPGLKRADIQYVMQEKRPVQIEGGAGFVPDAGVGLVWRIKATLTNLFGDGRRIGIDSERREKDRTRLDISYVQPFFLFGNGELAFDLTNRDYRNDFSEFHIGGTYTTQLSYRSRTSLKLDWGRVEPAVNEPGYSRYAAAIGFEHENIADTLNPLRGWRLGGDITFVHRRYSSPSPAIGSQVVTETRNRLNVDYFQPVVGSLVWRFRFAWLGYETNQGLPPLAELYLLGGPGSLRGYRNEQFAVQRAALGTIEPRWRFSQGFLFAFYDAAYLNHQAAASDSTVTISERYRDSYGFGLGLLAERRRVIISLGWSRESAFDQPRLSIALSSEL